MTKRPKQLQYDGRDLDDIRCEMGMSVAEFCQFLQYSETDYMNLVNNRRKMSVFEMVCFIIDTSRTPKSLK